MGMTGISHAGGGGSLSLLAQQERANLQKAIKYEEIDLR